MSDERSISVAELLARNGAAATPPAGGRRRRHRVGENSITVADLTGEIPVVRDKAPAAEAPEQAVEPQAQTPSEQPESHPVATDETDTFDAVAGETDTFDAVAGETDTFDAVADGPAPDAADEQIQTDDPAAEDEPVGSAALAQAVADTGRFRAIDPGNVDEHPIQSRVQRPEAEYETDVEPDYDEPAVRATESDAEPTHAWSQWSGESAPGMATADFNTALVRERQARRQAEAEAETGQNPVQPAIGVPDTASMSVQQISDAQDDEVDTERPAASSADTERPAASSADTADVEPAATDGRRGWGLLIAEVLLGAIAGAALFYGFYQLWRWGGGTWPYALTVALAFVVIIAIVTFTHYLRKSTDYLTLGLALFAGLVITFGPLLMSLTQN